jgi:hypothetical protein
MNVRNISIAMVLALAAASPPALAQGLSQQPPGQPAGVAPPPPGTNPARPPAAGAPPSTGACDPTFGGKYRVLLRVLAVPRDAGQYGACNDYGPWQGTSYAGHINLPPGAYWSYSAPNWYVWAVRAGNPYHYGGCPDPSVGGKYAGYLMRLHVPGDVGQYGRCNDYGRWTGTSYAGYSNLPSGAFWVYSAPYWIVWSQQVR